MYNFSADDARRFAWEQRANIREHGDELEFQLCPYCHGGAHQDKETFSINLRTGVFHCLRASCGRSGNMLTLSKDFDFSLGEESEEVHPPKKSFRKIKNPGHKIEPKQPAIKYLESRGIPEEITKQYEITTQTDHSNILVFPFYDENGNLMFIKYRKTDFDRSRDKNKEWCEKNCKPILFGMKQCEHFDRLIITEGQIDSLSVAAAGIKNAVSVPTGAKGFTWVAHCWEWVSKFEQIVVFGDYENGQITLLSELQKRFPNKIKHVRETDYRDCKDANELLQKYGKESVKRAVEQAVSVSVKKVVPMECVEDIDIYDLEKLKTGISTLDNLLYGGLPFGSVCLISGKRGEGKSTLASQIMANAVEQGYVTFAYSGELPNYMYRSWFNFQIAGPKRIMNEIDESSGVPDRYITPSDKEKIASWYSGKAFLYDSQIADDDEKTTILETVTNAIQQFGVKVILIDNLMTAMYDEPNQSESKFDQQGVFVQHLTKIALQYDCLILLVAHMRKNSYGDMNDNVCGSGDITNLAGISLSYNSDKNLKENQRKLVLAKNRLFGKTDLDGIVLDYDEVSKRIYGSGDDVNREFGWMKTDDICDVEEDMDDVPFD